MGSLVSTTAAAWVIAKYATRLAPDVGLIGVGWAAYNVVQVFFMDGGEFGIDIKPNRPLWYPAVLLALGIVIYAHIKERKRWHVRHRSAVQVGKTMVRKRFIVNL